MKSFIKRYLDVAFLFLSFFIVFLGAYYSFMNYGLSPSLGEPCLTSALLGECLALFSLSCGMVLFHLFSFIIRKLRHRAGKEEA